MRREGGRGGREPRTNNDEKSPPSIFFFFFSPRLELGLGGEFELAVKTEGAEAGGWGRVEQGRGPALSQCLLVTKGPGPPTAQPPGRPRPRSPVGLHGNVWPRRAAPPRSRLGAGLQGQGPLSLTPAPSSHLHSYFREWGPLGNG